MIVIFFRTGSVCLAIKFLRPLGRCRWKRFSNAKSDFPSIVVVITPILLMDHRWSLSLITGCVLFAYHPHTARPVNFTPKLTPIHPNWLAPVVVVVIDKYIGLVSSGSITTPTSSFIKTKCLPRTARCYELFTEWLVTAQRIFMGCAVITVFFFFFCFKFFLCSFI